MSYFLKFTTGLLFLAICSPFAASAETEKERKEREKNEKHRAGIERFVDGDTIGRINKELAKIGKKLKRSEVDPQRNRKPNVQKDLAKQFEPGNVDYSSNGRGLTETLVRSGLDSEPMNGEFDLHAIDGHLGSYTSDVIRYKVENGKVVGARVINAGAPSQNRQTEEVSIYPPELPNAKAGLIRLLGQEILVCDLINNKSLDDRMREIMKETAGGFEAAVGGQSASVKEKVVAALQKDPVTKDLVRGVDPAVLVNVHSHTYTKTKRKYWIFGEKRTLPYEDRYIALNIPGYDTIFFDGNRLFTHGADFDDTKVAPVFNYGPTVDCNEGDVKRLRARIEELKTNSANIGSANPQ